MSHEKHCLHVSQMVCSCLSVENKIQSWPDYMLKASLAFRDYIIGTQIVFNINSIWFLIRHWLKLISICKHLPPFHRLCSYFCGKTPSIALRFITICTDAWNAALIYLIIIPVQISMSKVTFDSNLENKWSLYSRAQENVLFWQSQTHAHL